MQPGIGGAGENGEKRSCPFDALTKGERRNVKCDKMLSFCDATCASFTATSFSGYAMVAVPEPGTLALLAAGLLGLLICVRWKRMRA